MFKKKYWTFFCKQNRNSKRETYSFALSKEYLCINLNKYLYKEMNVLVRECHRKRNKNLYKENNNYVK